MKYMTFHPKGLFATIGFLAVVWLGVYARAGQLHPGWAIAGGAAYVIVEAAMFFGISSIKSARSK
jgi:hypothetical protein